MRRGFKTLSERLAAEVRDELGVHGHAPFDPFAYAAEILRIPCEPFSALSQDGCSEETLAHLAGAGRQDFSAGTFYLGTRRLILFNEHNSTARRNSDVAHELAHVLCEHEPGPALGTGGCRVWDQVQEDEASWLSGVLLVPRAAALRVARRRTPVEQAALDYHVSVDLMKWRLNKSGARIQAGREARKARGR